ncbi:hypothetical protein ABXJ56_09630 [Microbacterium chocolatum]|uniref:hypothetical protein n=1 Tax=Microbacterium aurantiacum TaxID=162393 RepID=UPI00338E2816
MTKPVFIAVTGPFRNVGDTVIRRLGLEWCRSVGLPHVYVGSGRGAWLEDLELDPSDVVFTSSRVWLKALVRALPSRPVLVVEPGEFSLTRPFYPWAGAHALLAVLVRLFGGRVIQLPRALARSDRSGRALYRAFTHTANLTLWRRDIPTKARTAVRSPDIAFSEIPDTDDDPSARDTIVVSVRGDREAPSIEALGVLRADAAVNGCRLVFLAQVEADNDWAREGASAMACESSVWDADVSSPTHESHVREIYRRSKAVLSDRLHVLVMAAAEGALPVAYSRVRADKAVAHFAAAGVDVSAYGDEDVLGSQQPVSDALRQSMRVRAELKQAGIRARSALETARLHAGGSSSRFKLRG